MSDAWIKKQVAKYANPKKGYGEADRVVDLKLKAYLKLVELAKPGLRFLDLGTNSGRVSEEMRKLGLKELGVDLPEIITQITYPINKVAMNLEVDFPEGSWDLVFCRETIEHLRNYEEVCKKIINCLTPDGRLVLTAPNNKRDFGAACPEHVCVFEGKKLDQLAVKCGGVVVEAFNERRQRVLVVTK